MIGKFGKVSIFRIEYIYFIFLFAHRERPVADRVPQPVSPLTSRRRSPYAIDTLTAVAGIDSYFQSIRSIVSELECHQASLVCGIQHDPVFFHMIEIEAESSFF